MVLARLLERKTSISGMVTAFTGVLTLFRDFGFPSSRRSAYHRHGRAGFNTVLDHMLVGVLLGLLAVSNGTVHRGLLPRAPTF